MKIKILFLLIMVLALVAAPSVAAYCTATTCYDCMCMDSCSDPFTLPRPKASYCSGECTMEELCCCYADCTIGEGTVGCASAANGCCDVGYECSYNHCCPSGSEWNSTTVQCEYPDTCYELGGDSYCAANFGAKDQCCGGPNTGRCEECCSPEGTYKDCGFCEFCDKSSGVGNWKCSYQVNQDLKYECPYTKICNSGECQCLDIDPNSGTGLPSAPIIEDCIEYTLVMCTDGCSADCIPSDTNTPPPDNAYFCRTGPSGNPLWSYSTFCLADNLPDCLEICVLQEGEGCDSHRSILYPNGCCDGTHHCVDNHCCPAGIAWDGTRCDIACASKGEECGIECCSSLACTDGHCCASGEFWNASSSQCDPTCNVPQLDPATTQYACLEDNREYLISEGTPAFGGTCGVGCYNVWHNGIKYSQACDVTEQCIKYYDMPDEDLKNCYACKENLAACCNGGATGMVARTDEDCKACNSNWYLSGCHCCPKGWEWDPVSLACIEHDPCYRPGSYPLFCNYRAPDSTSPQPGWWNTPFNLYQCINTTSLKACCVLGEGIFGQEPGDDYYYWHERENIVVY